MNSLSARIGRQRELLSISVDVEKATTVGLLVFTDSRLRIGENVFVGFQVVGKIRELIEAARVVKSYTALDGYLAEKGRRGVIYELQFTSLSDSAREALSNLKGT